MSNYRGVEAAVIALKNALYDQYTGIDGAGEPDIGPPVVPSSSGGVRIFPYRIGFMPGSRNDDLPTRTRDGVVRARPAQTLEVQALICFCSDDWDVNLRIAGATAAILHGRPYLSNENFEPADELYDSMDRVNVTLDLMPADDLSRLWSSLFEMDYVLALPIRMAGILVEAKAAPTRVVLPVRTPMVYARTFGGPTIETIEHEDGPTTPIEADQAIVITGTHLRAATTLVRIGSTIHELKLGATDANYRDSVTNQRIRFSLYHEADYPESGDPAGVVAGLHAGIHRVQVLQDYEQDTDGSWSMGTRGVASNVVAMVVRPRIDSVGTATATTVTVTVVPAIAAGQSCRLFLAGYEPDGGDPTTGDPNDTGYQLTKITSTLPATTVTFESPDTVAAGSYKLRLQVDGVDNVPTWSGTAWTVPTVSV